MILANAINPILLAAAAVAVEPAAGKSPRVSIVAYTGGVMQTGYGRVVIDLAGLQIPATFPLLSDHNAAADGIVGQGTAAVRAGQLLVSGDLLAGPATDRLVNLAKSGFNWQASVGVEPLTTQYVKAGQAVTVNGKTINESRPFTLVATGRLRETSILSIGADPQTTVAIAAKGITTMTFEEWLKANGFDGITLTDTQRATLQASYNAQQQSSQHTAPADPATAERLRASSVASIAASFPAIAAQAIADGWDESRTRTEVLTQLRASRPIVHAGGAGRNTIAGPVAIEAAFLAHAGYASVGEKMLGATAMQQGRDLQCRSMLDICASALRLSGADVPTGRNDMIRAALSTISLPTALGNAAGKVLLQAYLESVPSWQSFATIKPAANFKTQTSVRSNMNGQLEPVASGGEIKHASMDESTYTWSIDTFGKMLGIDRQSIINDDLGLFNDAAMGLGRMARRSLSDLIWKTILANAGSFFSSGNANYVTGSATNLTTTSLSDGITAMRQQRDKNDVDLDIMPKVLVVPPELEQTAKSVLQSDYIQLTASNTGPTGNTMKDAVILQVEPRLSNSDRFTGTSQTAWYLFASPNDGAVTVGFLDGQQTPTVEFFGFNSEPSKLQASWRVYHDYGCALSDPRAAYKSKGAA